jgi:hypothetical protein
MAAGRNLPSKKIVMNRQGGGRFVRAAALSCPQASCHGAFSPPCRYAGKRENRRNQSQLSRRPDMPAQAPMTPHMAQFAAKCKGPHVAVQQNLDQRLRLHPPSRTITTIYRPAQEIDQ